MTETKSLKRARFWLILFVVALVASGLTAIPVQTEVGLLAKIIGDDSWMARTWPGLADWISLVHRGVAETSDKYPFLFYGNDWLAFGHIVVALFFVGAIRDPLRNQWVIEAGIIACLLVIPFALVMGHLRGIPLFWRLIDCSFGVVGLAPLFAARKWTRRLAASPEPIRKQNER